MVNGIWKKNNTDDDYGEHNNNATNPKAPIRDSTEANYKRICN